MYRYYAIFRVLTALAILTSSLALAYEPLPLPAWTHGNQVLVHYDPQPIYAAIKRVLRGARSSIALDFYIFWGPDAEEIVDILIAKSHKHVRVRVILDPALGVTGKMHTQSVKLLRRLQAASSEFLEVYTAPVHLLPKLARNIDHNKIVIVDERIVMTGGMNVGENFASYHDNMVEMIGPIAKRALALFDRNFELAKSEAEDPSAERIFPRHAAIGRDDLEIAKILQHKKSNAKTSAIRWIDTGPGRIHAYQVILQRIDEAKTSIDLLMSEFQGVEFMDALIRAHQRKVKIRALIDADDNLGDFAPVGHALDGLLNAKAIVRLAKAGIEVRAFDFSDRYTRSHAKVAVFDNTIASTGACNWSTELQGNFESNVEIIGGPGFAQITNKFEEFWNGSGPPKPPTAFVLGLNALAYRLGIFGKNPLLGRDNKELSVEETRNEHERVDNLLQIFPFTLQQ